MAVEEPTSKQRLTSKTYRPADLQVGPVGPTYHPPTVCFGGMPSGACLLESSRVVFVMDNYD